MRRGFRSGQLALLGPVLTLLALVLTAAAAAFAQDDATPEGSQNARSGSVSEAGARLYATNCAVCHGATGKGLAEAKEAFPTDHRHCQRCHRPGNPPVMSLAQIEARQHDLFDIGTPPPLRGEGAMATTADPLALRTYLAATMPRYRPGALSGEEYQALAAFLLQLNGRQLQ